MRLLVEYSHPAQAHKFKHLLRRLMDQGHQVLILSRKKEMLTDLLDDMSLPHVCVSTARAGTIGLAFELLVREVRALYHILRFKPDLILSAQSVATSHVGWLLRIPCIVHDDTEFAALQEKLFIPFATYLLTSTAYLKRFGAKQLCINSLEPLAYLHPNWFAPSTAVLTRYGLSTNRRHAVVRFVSHRASHDRKSLKLTRDMRVRAIETLLDAGAETIVVSEEDVDTTKGFPRGVIRPTRPSDFHHLLNYARLCFGDSITVANEAAVLGVPSILINPLRAGHTLELERYGLVERITDFDRALSRSVALWRDQDSVSRWAAARLQLLREKDDMVQAMEALLLRIAGEGRQV